MFHAKLIDFKNRGRDFKTLHSSNFYNECVQYLEQRGYTFSHNSELKKQLGIFKKTEIFDSGNKTRQILCIIMED